MVVSCIRLFLLIAYVFIAIILYRSGSPSMEDIEAFSTEYRSKLDEAESRGSIPANISLEVVYLTKDFLNSIPVESNSRSLS